MNKCEVYEQYNPRDIKMSQDQIFDLLKENVLSKCPDATFEKPIFKVEDYWDGKNHYKEMPATGGIAEIMSVRIRFYTNFNL